MGKNKRGQKKKTPQAIKEIDQPGFIKHPFIIIFILTAIVYVQAISFDFVYLDDDLIILDNHDKISSLSDIGDAFTSEYGFSQGTPYYRPVVNISFIIDSQFSGKSPVFYHISNIIFHFLAASFLFVLLLELGIKRQISLLLALLFAVHPLLTNAVDWIVGRNDMLAGLFTILSFLYLVRFLNKEKVKYLYLHILFFSIAIFTKEVSLFLPVIALIYLFLFRREKLKPRYLLRLILLWFLPVIVFLSLRYIFIPPAENVTYGLPALLANIHIIPEIIYKTFIPVDISVLPTFSLVKTIIGLAFLLIIIVLPFVIKKINRKKYFFGLLWFLTFILPGLLILYADQEAKFEYLDSRVYLPIIGILLIIGEVLTAADFRLTNKRHLGFGIVILLILSILTFNQSKKYKDAITFAESAVASNPEKPFFYHKLADYYFTTRDFPEAIKYMKIAIKKDPYNMEYYKNLTLAYANLQEYDNAIQTIKDALKLKPNDPELIKGLFFLNYRKGDYTEALKYADLYISLGGKIGKKLYDDLKSKQE